MSHTDKLHMKEDMVSLISHSHLQDGGQKLTKW